MFLANVDALVAQPEIYVVGQQQIDFPGQSLFFKSNHTQGAGLEINEIDKFMDLACNCLQMALSMRTKVRMRNTLAICLQEFRPFKLL